MRHNHGMGTTKRTLTAAELEKVLGETPLSSENHEGGMFATVVSACLADGSEVVVKVGPPDGVTTLLSHEHGLMSTEVEVLQRAAEDPEIRMPHLIRADLSRSVIDADYFVASKLAGTRWDQAGLEPRAQLVAERELGATLRALHRIEGASFGYPQARAPHLSRPTWRAAFTAMVEAIFADAAIWKVPLDADRIRRAIDQPALDDVTIPVLVHADAWFGNAFVDPEGHLTGVIDAERALWGDHLFDLAAVEQMVTGAVNPGVLEGYGDTDYDQVRVDLYKLYITVIMIVEIVPRGYDYDWLPDHEATLHRNLEALLAALERTSEPKLYRT